MPFFDYLERLREKPEPTRQKILLLASVALTLFIAALWLSSFRLEPLRGGESGRKAGGGETHPSVLGVREFLVTLRSAVNDVGAGFGVVRDRVEHQFEDYRN